MLAIMCRAAIGSVVCLLWLACPARAAEDLFFDSDGVKLRYMVEGEGEPVLLIHGLGASAQLQWALPGTLKELAENYHVIAYDNRGHGRSGKPHREEKYGEEMVGDAIRLLDHLDIPRAHIVGYSMGAIITCRLLVEHPERFFTATLGGAGWVKPDDERAAFMEDVIASLEQGKGIRPLLLKLTLPDRPQPSETKLKVANVAFGLLNDQKALAAVARGMKKLTVTEEQLKANRVPTLAVIGEDDPLKVTVDELVAVMPNVELTVIKDADHVQAFRTPEFAARIKSFLAEHPQSAR
ncbi:MAG TPA: alpha/beta hydrolase [Pirellulales bacterium]|nr:alpha/beta hydrolase [Pirellulales bacterium]